MTQPGSPNPEIVVVGSLNTDITVPVDRLPAPGETVLGGDALTGAGGKGANQAVAAALLGRSVAMVGRVGADDRGASLLAGLDAAGVERSEVATDPLVPTGLALITVGGDGENMIVVSPGANGLVRAADVAAAPSIAVAAVTLLQLEVPLEAVTAAARVSTGTVILNPAPASPLPAALLAEVDVLVPNRTELALLAGGATPATIEDAVAMARSIDGPDAVVVTMGADGALVVTRRDAEHVPAIPVDAVDATAAGDSFCGALADALVRGLGLADAVEWAVAAGAITVTRPGAQSSLPTRDEVMSLVGAE